MRAHRLGASELIERRPAGWVVAHDVRDRRGTRIIRKGEVLNQDSIAALAEADETPIHVVEPEPDDLHENEAGQRLARAVAGPGVSIKGPAQSRYNLIAATKGVLRIDQELVRAINQIYGMSVFTLLDRQVVLPGKIVTGVKVTPLIVREANVERVEALIREAGRPVVQVVPFQPKRVGVIATEGLTDKLRERFVRSVEQKMRWYGSEVTEVRFLEADADVVAESLAELAASNDVVLVGGGNTIDPLDPAYRALEQTGATMIHFGAPSHPGSMFWLAELNDAPIFNLASCSMYSSATFADLILPLVMTGQQVTEEEIDEFGYGGLLEREMRFRFPPYDQERSDEANE